MRVFWFCLLLQTVYTQAAFGTSYLKNSRLCHQWTCLNQKLGLPNDLPSREHYSSILRSLLPEGPWQSVISSALDVCYGERPRSYSNTCPGQALMHCMVDQLNAHCPEESLRKDDACSPITSIGGFKYLFSQSRYENLDENLRYEIRPTWFLKNYFNQNCCNLPPLFNTSTLTECGVNHFINYYSHQPRYTTHNALSRGSVKNEAERTMVQVTDVNNKKNGPDPLDCCDMSEFIAPSWRSECDFHFTWTNDKRLVVSDSVVLTTTTTPASTTVKAHNDVKIVPLSCEKENCIFKKLNIVSDSGAVDKEAFSRLLDNMTNAHPAWLKAKARVLTDCLHRTIIHYTGECEINKILACTMDVLSENCPYANKTDPCRHSRSFIGDMACQVSSSVYRPKSRRQFCGIPNLVNNKVLTECGVNSISRRENVPPPPIPRLPKYSIQIYQNICIEVTEPTKCLMDKMGILSRYGFMDYFKMKDRIRNFTNAPTDWSSLQTTYLNIVMGTSMLYTDYCNTPNKLFNVVDAMLLTCPASRKKQTDECKRIFNEMSNNVNYLKQQNITKESLDQILQRFYKQVFLGQQENVKNKVNLANVPNTHVEAVSGASIRNENVVEDNSYNPLQSFAVFSADTPPPVKILKIGPTPLGKPPVVVRNSQTLRSNYSMNSFYRASPFLAHSPVVYDESEKM